MYRVWYTLLLLHYLWQKNTEGLYYSENKRSYKKKKNQTTNVYITPHNKRTTTLLYEIGYGFRLVFSHF